MSTMPKISSSCMLTAAVARLWWVVADGVWICGIIVVWVGGVFNGGESFVSMVVVVWCG